MGSSLSVQSRFPEAAIGTRTQYVGKGSCIYCFFFAEPLKDSGGERCQMASVNPTKRTCQQDRGEFDTACGVNLAPPASFPYLHTIS